MYILTSVSNNMKSVRIYDTNDGTNDEMKLATVVANMDKVGRIYGLRKGQPDAFVPPDARFIPAFGVTIIPSEAKEAMLQYRNS